MTVAAVLVAYAATLGILVPGMLRRATWTARAPLLAIVTYLAAGWSVIGMLRSRAPRAARVRVRRRESPRPWRGLRR